MSRIAFLVAGIGVVFTLGLVTHGCGGEENNGNTSTATGGANSGNGGSTNSSSGGTTASTGGTTSSSGGTTASTGGTTSSTGGTSASTGGTSASTGGATSGDAGIIELCPEALSPGDGKAWPVGLAMTVCDKKCGPDLVGLKKCTKLADDIADCDPCRYEPLPVCYQPPALGTPLAACAVGTVKGGACTQECAGICTQVDPADALKIQGCVCTKASGSLKWGCATIDPVKYTWKG